MKELVLQAKPRSLAIAGAFPFLVAFATFASQPLSRGGHVVFALALYLGVTMALLWAWVVGHALNARMAIPQRPARGGFRLAVSFCAAYVAFFLSGWLRGDLPFVLGSPALFFSLHLVAMLATVKVVHFIGTNLALAEKAEGYDSDSAWPTTLILFSIGGILPVQKRVNRLFESSSGTARG